MVVNGFVGNLILVNAAIFNGFNSLWKVFVNSFVNKQCSRCSLGATSLSKSTNPSASRFSEAKPGLASRSWFRSNPNSPTALSSSPSSTKPWNGSSWSSTAPSWASSETPDWLSETVSKCLLSHFTSTFLEYHHGIENWCSGQLFILVNHSDDLTNNMGPVFSLQWLEMERKRKHINPLHLELVDVFLKYCQGKNEPKHIIQWQYWYSSYFTDNISSNSSKHKQL